MVTKFNIGDEVLVPSKLVKDDDGPALKRVHIISQSKRSIEVATDGPVGTDRYVFGSSRATPSFFALVVTFGDLATEDSTLDPLSDGIDRVFRLLVPHSYSATLKIRTCVELRTVLSTVGVGATHIIVVGHGGPAGLGLLDGHLSGTDFGELLDDECAEGPQKRVISTACQTGRAVFGKGIAASDQCLSFDGPFQSIHAASSLQYVQCYFTSLLLSGKSHAIATKSALAAMPTGFHFNSYR